ncbi:unnamed protein product [Parnassius mnemosyne]|uniref:Tc1-like transposase DDE domain-containing protein n=1 Tax=Parnassius mnemosyne TaxID=213953 RepID=A0AAV1LMN0_9NEOP
MEPEPSTSRPFKEFVSPRKKRKMSHFSVSEKQQRPIYYLDETWVNAGHTVGKVWEDTTVQSRKQAFLEVTSWKKIDIQEWLSSKQISFEAKETKVQLLKKVKDVKIQYQSYVVDELAKAVGVEVLRLPPYHCELNPIELVWADVKGYVARKNTTFKMADVKKLLQQALGNISAEKWQNCISHVKKEESKLARLDDNVDKTVDSFVINVTGETSSESSYSDTEESDSDL